MDNFVYLQGQDHAHDEPQHRCTRTVMRLVLAAELAEQVGENAIRLTTDIEWKDVKALARLVITRRELEMRPSLAIREYPLNEMCLSSDFQRQMDYPILLARDQRSAWTRWAEAV